MTNLILQSNDSPTAIFDWTTGTTGCNGSATEVIGAIPLLEAALEYAIQLRERTKVNKIDAGWKKQGVKEYHVFTRDYAGSPMNNDTHIYKSTSLFDCLVAARRCLRRDNRDFLIRIGSKENCIWERNNDEERFYFAQPIITTPLEALKIVETALRRMPSGDTRDAFTRHLAQEGICFDEIISAIEKGVSKP